GIRDWSVTGVQTCALPISRIVGERARRAGAVGRTRTDLCSPRVDAKFRDCERSADRGAACTYHERRSSGALSADTFLKQAQPGRSEERRVGNGGETRWEAD